MIDGEKKYNDLIDTLKNLQQVKAAPNFEADLKRKLKEQKYGKEKEKRIKSFLVPSRLIPSFGLAVAAVIVILSIDVNSDEADNPFLIEPKLREDIISISDVNEVKLPEEIMSSEGGIVKEEKGRDKKDNLTRSERTFEEDSFDENLVAGRELSEAESTLTDETDTDLTDGASSPSATGFAIRKSGLNFRQIKPSETEQQKIIELKKKVQKKDKFSELK